MSTRAIFWEQNARIAINIRASRVTPGLSVRIRAALQFACSHCRYVSYVFAKLDFATARRMFRGAPIMK